jgi:hypothetical protein
VWTSMRRPNHDDVTVDVTFPVSSWGGGTPLPLACGPGDDHPAGDDPLRSKAALVERWSDSAARERFIAALGDVERSAP